MHGRLQVKLPGGVMMSAYRNFVSQAGVLFAWCVCLSARVHEALRDGYSMESASVLWKSSVVRRPLDTLAARLSLGAFMH